MDQLRSTLSNGVNPATVLLFLSTVILNVSAETYYVTPTANTSCPEEGVPCMTLSQYATTPNGYFASDTSLILLPGNHSLNSSLSITTIANLSIFASQSTMNNTQETRVSCNRGAGFHLQDIEAIRVHGTDFLGCAVNVTFVDIFTIDQARLVSREMTSRLELNMVETANIYECIFSNNGFPNGTRNDLIFRLGGALFINQSNVSIRRSEFDQNSAYYGSSVYAVNSSVGVLDTNFTDNTAVYQGGAIMLAQESTITIDGCTFTNNNIYQIEHANAIGEHVSDGHTLGGGVVSVQDRSTIMVNNSVFLNNSVQVHNDIHHDSTTANGGAMFVSTRSNAVIDNCVFMDNRAAHGGGGALTARLFSVVFITNTHFINNTALNRLDTHMTTGGGACDVSTSNLTVEGCTFISNVAERNSRGGAIVITYGLATISNSVLRNNIGNHGAGAIASIDESICYVSNCSFSKNVALRQDGGAFACEKCHYTIIEKCTFNSNTVYSNTANGGAVNVFCGKGLCHVFVEDSVFTNNTAQTVGGAVALFAANLTTRGTLHFEGNNGSPGGVLTAESSVVHFSGNTTFSNNFGSLSVFAFNSHMIFGGNVTITNNSRDVFLPLPEQGGALTSYLSVVYFTGRVVISHNTAVDGGAILSTESEMYVYPTGELTASNNFAARSGGGISMYQSLLYCEGRTNIVNNTAVQTGGGIHVSGARITLLSGSLTLVGNKANKKGGGMYLESNAKIYLIKFEPECKNGTVMDECQYNQSGWLSLHFVDNSADLGGAVYIDDGATSDVCSALPFNSRPSGQCFFQALALYNTAQVANISTFFQQLNLINTHFVNNTARIAGNSLFGGLLDRCEVSQLAEVAINNRVTADQQRLPYLDAITYFFGTATNLQAKAVSSLPVRVCFCKDNRVDCSYQPLPVYVKKGQSFTIDVVTVDQVNKTIPSRVHSLVSSFNGSLNRGQAIQRTRKRCTALRYNVNSPHENETMSIFSGGPCGNRGISGSKIELKFLPCPAGFKESSNGCDCDPIISDYLLNCSTDSQLVKRKRNIWISFDNTTDPGLFAVYPNCPFDYCIPTSAEVDMTTPNGADMQCAFNRSGLLCGRCDEGLSLMLGSSHCGECSNNGLALVIFFALAGIALVAFVLFFNLTVAVGTVNGLIFYANVMSANNATFFPAHIEQPNTFIAWLNLDFGIETCFFNGMDGYTNTWLQLVFPMYVIFLVILIIVLCQYSQRMSQFLSNSDPIATLATLILLSYAKLLQLIIASLSYARIILLSDELETQLLYAWKVDANIKYFGGKHIPLFLVTLIIVLLGLVFTFVLLFWQCILRCPNRHPMKWVSNARLKSFIDVYHVPYKSRHRYWPGLLLLIRVVLYVIILANLNNAPEVNLWITSIAVGTLLFISSMSGAGVYKTWPVNALEHTFLYNLFILSATSTVNLVLRKERIVSDLTWQAALSYTSITIAFVTFLGILIYHLCAFVLAKFVPMRNCGKRLKYMFRTKKDEPQRNKVKRRRPFSLNTKSLQQRVVRFADLRSPLESIIAMDPVPELEEMNSNQQENRELSHEIEQMDHISEEHSDHEQERHGDKDVGEHDIKLKKVRAVTHSVIDGVTPYDDYESTD